MKYGCLGYVEANKLDMLGESERNAIIDECLAYDVLRKNGHFAGGEPLAGPNTAKTLRWKKGKVRVIDGRVAETKEITGGILSLEARDMDHAIELMSKHLGVKIGPFEIRPVADFAEIIRESQQRRGTT
jgi:hypothetical protein